MGLRIPHEHSNYATVLGFVCLLANVALVVILIYLINIPKSLDKTFKDMPELFTAATFTGYLLFGGAYIQYKMAEKYHNNVKKLKKSEQS